MMAVGVIATREEYARGLPLKATGRVNERIRQGKGWPTTAKALAGVLRWLAPNLRGVGVEVTPR
jgi:hypothetical protein